MRPDIKKFAWNVKGKKEKIEASFLPISCYPDQFHPGYPLVFCQQVLSTLLIFLFFVHTDQKMFISFHLSILFLNLIA